MVLGSDERDARDVHHLACRITEFLPRQEQTEVG